MGHMAVSHQIVLLTQLGDTAAEFGAPVDGHKFTQNRTATDFDIGHFALELERLGLVADGGVLENLAVGTDIDVLIDGRMGADHRIGPDMDMVFDNAIYS